MDWPILRPLTLVLIAAGMLGCGTEAQHVDREAFTNGLEGVYQAQASMGEVTVPARLELQRGERGYRGRLTLTMGGPVYVALRSIAREGNQHRFATSSPATQLELAVVNDSLDGRLHLSGNRTVTLTGARISGETVPADFGVHFELSPFEPSVISAENRGEAFPTFTPDGETLYFSAYDTDFGFHTIMVARYTNGSWTIPDTASFSGRYSDRSPAVSPDGTRLIFASRRPLPDQPTESEVYNLWELTAGADGGWNEPRPIASVNTDASDYQPTLMADGTLYFTSDRDGSQDLYRARLVGNSYGEPEKLSERINTDESEMSSFVSPDGSYLIFATSAAHDGHVGSDDLYVSFLRDGQWTEPQNLGQPINSFANEYGPVISPDGRYLFFTSDRHPPASIYRVETEALGLDE